MKVPPPIKIEMNKIELTNEELSFLEDVLNPMLDKYVEESEDFVDEEYYAETEMNLTNDILRKLITNKNK